MERERSAAIRRQGLRLAPQEPGERQGSKNEECGENGAPGADLKDQLAECWRQHRRQDEHRHDQREDARHVAPAMPVANYGERYDAWPGGAGPLEKPADKQDLEPVRQEGEKRAAEI